MFSDNVEPKEPWSSLSRKDILLIQIALAKKHEPTSYLTCSEISNYFLIRYRQFIFHITDNLLNAVLPDVNEDIMSDKWNDDV